jgi:hypothetical protein
MTDDLRISALLSEIEAHMRRLIAAEAGRYEVAWEIWGKAMSAVDSPDLTHPLWLIWGALTDWVELRPEETYQAEQAMVRAATEWLSLPYGDATARKNYLDRWVFDELGYEPTSA